MSEVDLRIDSPVRDAFNKYLASDLGKAHLQTIGYDDRSVGILWAVFLTGWKARP